MTMEDEKLLFIEKNSKILDQALKQNELIRKFEIINIDNYGYYEKRFVFNYKILTKNNLENEIKITFYRKDEITNKVVLKLQTGKIENISSRIKISELAYSLEKTIKNIKEYRLNFLFNTIEFEHHDEVEYIINPANYNYRKTINYFYDKKNIIDNLIKQIKDSGYGRSNDREFILMTTEDEIHIFNYLLEQNILEKVFNLNGMFTYKLKNEYNFEHNLQQLISVLYQIEINVKSVYFDLNEEYNEEYCDEMWYLRGYDCIDEELFYKKDNKMYDIDLLPKTIKMRQKNKKKIKDKESKKA